MNLRSQHRKTLSFILAWISLASTTPFANAFPVKPSLENCRGAMRDEVGGSGLAPRAAALAKGARIVELYDKTHEHVAPMVFGAVDTLLRNASVHAQSKIMFIARDGLGGYEAARILIQRFPKRYPGLNDQSVKFLYLNKHTTRSPHATEYLRQAGVNEGTPVYFFDLGWYGTLTGSFKSLAQSAGGEFKGLRLILSPAAGAFINLSESPGPFRSIPGNPAVHFLEDTYSGAAPRPSELSRDPQGVISPVFPKADYTGTDLDKRITAIEAIKEAARAISESDLAAITPAGAREKLYQLVSDRSAFETIMVPHERH